MCVAAAIAGGAVVGAVASNSAAKKQAGAAKDAAETSANASNYAANLQQQQYEQQRDDEAPWRTIGENALTQLGGGNLNGVSSNFLRPFGMSDFQQDPGYQFRLDQGMKSLQNSAAARGGLLSGNALRGISRYGQDYASNEYQNSYNRYVTNQSNAFNRLASVAGLGQTANNALGQAGQNYANNSSNIAMQNGANQSNALLAAGQARASSYQGIGNAFGNALGSYQNTPSSRNYYTNPMSAGNYYSAAPVTTNGGSFNPEN